MGEVSSFRKMQAAAIAVIATIAMSIGLAGMQQTAYADDGQLLAGSMMLSTQTGTTVSAGSGATKANYTVTSAKSKTVAYKAPKSNAKSLTVPSAVKINGKAYKVTSIAANAFKKNTKVTKITVGKYVKTIGKAAFAGCTKLKSLTVGAGLTSIKAKAFAGDKNLKSITLKTSKLTKAGVKNALTGSSVKVVKVPKAKVATYKKIFTKANCGKKVTVKAA